MASNLPTPSSSSQLSTTSSPGLHPGGDSFTFSASPSPCPGSAVASFDRSQPASPANNLYDASISIDISRPHESFFTERFSMFHFDLLLHFRGSLTDAFLALQPQVAHILRLAYTEALKAPYLMDQVLAFAAAHKSTVTEDMNSKSTYQFEATRLQSRAISELGISDVVVTEENVLGLFCFSILLGQHVLFDAFATAVSIPTVLDKLVQCLTLHHGIRNIVGQSMEKFQAQLQQHVPPPDPAHMEADVTHLSLGTECDDLLQRLQESETNEQTKSVYIKVVKILQYLFHSVRVNKDRKFIVVQEWPVRVSQEYIAFLQQRRPEALVILAHYAVLLHWAKDYWAVGNSGEFLIRATSSHLGTYWSDWLEWPNQQLSVTSPGGS